MMANTLRRRSVRLHNQLSCSATVLSSFLPEDETTLHTQPQKRRRSNSRKLRNETCKINRKSASGTGPVARMGKAPCSITELTEGKGKSAARVSESGQKTSLTREKRGEKGNLPAPTLVNGLQGPPLVIDRATVQKNLESTVLKDVISKHGLPSFFFETDKNKFPFGDGELSPYHHLLKAIIYQQLAGSAASAIYNRFLNLFSESGGKNGGKINSDSDKTSKEGKVKLIRALPTPEEVLSRDFETLRSVGLSSAKTKYIIDLSSHFASGKITDESILVMSDEEVSQTLQAVKGIGPWSVDMFLMFYLKRLDILPVGDLGVKKGFKTIFNLSELPTPIQMQELAEQWRPFRSVASWLMWRVVEMNSLPTASSKTGTKRRTAVKKITMKERTATTNIDKAVRKTNKTRQAVKAVGDTAAASTSVSERKRSRNNAKTSQIRVKKDGDIRSIADDNTEKQSKVGINGTQQSLPTNLTKRGTKHTKSAITMQQKHKAGVSIGTPKPEKESKRRQRSIVANPESAKEDETVGKEHNYAEKTIMDSAGPTRKSTRKRTKPLAACSLQLI